MYQRFVEGLATIHRWPITQQSTTYRRYINISFTYYRRSIRNLSASCLQTFHYLSAINRWPWINRCHLDDIWTPICCLQKDYRSLTDKKKNHKRYIENCLLPRSLIENQSIIYRWPIQGLLKSIDCMSIMAFGTAMDHL